MRRRDFLQVAAILGITAAVSGCGEDEATSDDQAMADDEGANPERDSSAHDPSEATAADDGPSVVVVGAGVAGMSAAYLLMQLGVDVTVLEARSFHGGRIEHRLDWVDFPIPLGAEWLHADAEELTRIVNDDSVDITTELAGYEPGALVGWYEDGELSSEPIDDEGDLKFVGSSWLDFFDTYVVPSIADRLLFDTAVSRIEYTKDQVVVIDAAGQVHRADAVIVTVPLVVLRDGDIEFDPPLPDDIVAVVEEADIWGGIKVFIEFEETFYPAFVALADSDTDEGQRVYYDAAYAQRSEANVLGLFAVGEQARPYQALGDDELITHVLDELDEIFDGAASRTYVRHVSRNWSDEPYIRQAYLSDHTDWREAEKLGGPVADRLFLAGDGYTDGRDWGNVHVAARSARTAVDGVLELL